MSRAKKKTVGRVPQNQQQLREHIRLLGDVQRRRDRVKADMNDKIAAIQEAYATHAAPLNQHIEELIVGIQTYAEANRAELTQDGKRKSLDLGTGEIGWRLTPPSIICKGVATIIETIKRKHLGKLYLRKKEELNKDAIPLEKSSTGEWSLPENLRGIPGLSVKVVEEFFVSPSETDLQEVA